MVIKREKTKHANFNGMCEGILMEQYLILRAFQASKESVVGQNAQPARCGSTKFLPRLLDALDAHLAFVFTGGFR